VNQAEQRAWTRAYARSGQLCGERNGDLLGRVSISRSGTHTPRRHPSAAQRRERTERPQWLWRPGEDHALSLLIAEELSIWQASRPQQGSGRRRVDGGVALSLRCRLKS